MQVSPPHLTDPWKKPCRSSQQERVSWAATDAPHILSILLEAIVAVRRLFTSTYRKVSWFLCSAGLHETLALLTSQLRPDANHKEDMVFLKDVFSERSLGYLMKASHTNNSCTSWYMHLCAERFVCSHYIRQKHLHTDGLSSFNVIYIYIYILNPVCVTDSWEVETVRATESSPCSPQCLFPGWGCKLNSHVQTLNLSLTWAQPSFTVS